MTEVLFLILPIFATIAIGTLFVWRRWFPADGLPALNLFVLRACIPALMFRAITGGGGLAAFAWTNTLLYAAGSLLACAAIALALRLVLRQPLSQSLILAMGSATSNSVFLGYPIASVVMPEKAAQVFSWVVLAEIAVIIPIMSTAALHAENRGARPSPAAILMPLLTSPVSLGLFAGFGFLASGLALPGWIAQVVGSITAAAPFLALFLIGGMLVEGRVTRAGPRVALVSFGKLVLHPLAVAAVFLAFGPGTEVLREAVLFAAIPIFATFVVFSGRHGVGEVGASAVVVSTLAGAVTVTALLSVLA